MVPPGDCKAFCPFAVFVSRELPSEAQQVQTQLHRSCSEDFYTYHNVPWKIFIRKEVQIMGTLGDRLVPRSYQDKRFTPSPDLSPGRFSTPRTASTIHCCSTSSSGR